MSIIGISKHKQSSGSFLYDLRCDQSGTKAYGIPLNQRLSTFKKYGYDTLIIWQHELAQPGFEQRLLGILTPCPLPILNP